MKKLIRIVAWPVSKAMQYTKDSEGYIIASKVVGASTGSVGIAKGTADALEALVCRDGVCFVVSVIGVGADTLQTLASFVPGPNVTTTVTIPLSLGCKTFVYCCKHSKLPWRAC